MLPLSYRGSVAPDPFPAGSGLTQPLLLAIALHGGGLLRPSLLASRRETSPRRQRWMPRGLVDSEAVWIPMSRPCLCCVPTPHGDLEFVSVCLLRCFQDSRSRQVTRELPPRTRHRPDPISEIEDSICVTAGTMDLGAADAGFSRHGAGASPPSIGGSQACWPIR